MNGPPTLEPTVLDQIRALPTAAEGGLVERLMSLYRRQASERIEALYLAAGEGDWPQVHRVAHAWKTSAGQLGAMRLHALLSRLDEQARSGLAAGGERLIVDVAAEHERVLEALPQR